MSKKDVLQSAKGNRSKPGPAASRTQMSKLNGVEWRYWNGKKVNHISHLKHTPNRFPITRSYLLLGGALSHYENLDTSF